MHRRNRPTGFFKNSNYRAKTTQPNDANYLERSKDNEYFETVDLDVPKHPLTLKNIKGYYIFKNPSRNNNLQRRPYYGNFLYDCEKICLVLKFYNSCLDRRSNRQRFESTRK
ncbi:hypothetical protein HZS_6812 [Henneguya salminicola]|nr:hypothetical protein HZS_6812 [Henneguya salminicola]